MIEPAINNSNSNIPVNPNSQDIKFKEGVQPQSNKNYYAEFMERIGFTKTAWIIFTLASLLQFIWGEETCFISINIDFLGKSQNFSSVTISVFICVLYSMMGVGSALIGVLTKNFGRIITLNVTIVTYIVATFSCSVLPNNFYIIFILRCINNIAIGVFNIVVLNLMSEFFPTRNRSL